MTEELNLSELFSNLVKFISRNIKLLITIVGISVVGVISYHVLVPKLAMINAQKDILNACKKLMKIYF